MPRKVDQMMNGILVKTYDSVKEASISLNCHPHAIHNACNPNNPRKTLLGYSWRYTDAEIPITGERWKKHPKYNIFVSDLGRIRRSSGRITKGTKKKGGYYHCNIDQSNVSIHRLVCETFLENPDNKPTVDHINRDRGDNRLINLRWATYSEQQMNKTYL